VEQVCNLFLPAQVENLCHQDEIDLAAAAGIMADK
jgi:hypothetical protein